MQIKKNKAYKKNSSKSKCLFFIHKIHLLKKSPALRKEQGIYKRSVNQCILNV